MKWLAVPPMLFKFSGTKANCLDKLDVYGTNLEIQLAVPSMLFKFSVSKAKQTI
jgi:hypothetical protein